MVAYKLVLGSPTGFFRPNRDGGEDVLALGSARVIASPLDRPTRGSVLIKTEGRNSGKSGRGISETVRYSRASGDGVDEVPLDRNVHRFVLDRTHVGASTEPTSRRLAPASGVGHPEFGHLPGGYRRFEVGSHRPRAPLNPPVERSKPGAKARDRSFEAPQGDFARSIR